MGKLSLHGLMFYRLVQVQELVHHGLVAYMVGDGAEAIIFRNACHESLAIVLTERLGIPRDAFLYVATVQAWLVH